MHMINESQKRALTEVLCAASDMLDLMAEAPPDVWDEEWRDAVRESIGGSRAMTLARTASGIRAGFCAL
jgi:hypothetical protein